MHLHPQEVILTPENAPEWYTLALNLSPKHLQALATQAIRQGVDIAGEPLGD